MSDEPIDRPPANHSTPLAVVGIGASAGGLEALERFFSTVADDTGLAYIILQHVDPAGSDAFQEALHKFTCLPVVRIGESTRLEPNTAYVSPAHSSIVCTNGEVKSVKLEGAKQRATSVDMFLQSLADAAERRAIGVVLSGAGADGTLGLKAIADAGGMTLAQDPESAQYDSMPGNAAATGVVDHVLPPEKMPSEIVAYARHIDGLQEAHGPASWDAVESVLPSVCNVLLKETEHDFKHYKSSTLVRRVLRRIQIRRIASAEQYLKLVQEDQDEAQLLFRELLIGVTSFFRDPDAFATLAEMVLPKLFANRAIDEPVRVWVPGCATGEEAYTLAILLREATSEVDPAPDFQIFATDINERALNHARHAVYPLSIAEHLTESRLKRFFIRRGGQYEVKKELRDRCTFSSHNLISDPPFSRLDLISCRNLLIYLGPQLQQKLIPVFHFSLRSGGFLLLGPSENLAEHTEVFRPVDKKHRISQRKEMAVKSGTLLPAQHRVRNVSGIDESAKANGNDIQQISQRILLDEFAPRYVVVDEDAHILCTSGNLDKYLALPEGTFQNNAVKLARTGLRGALRSALHQARRNKRKVTHDDLSVSYGEQVQRVQLVVQPMPSLGGDSSLFMIVFKDLSELVSPNANAEASPTSDDSLAEQLERELNRTRDELENTVQELERSNEELKSSNEELLSMNEELQTANEELETSKEEIQAGMEALDRSKSDLENLLHGTRIGTIFLDTDGNIRSFTPAATEIYSIRPSDVGRPLVELRHNVIEMPSLPKLSALENADMFAGEEISATDGRWFLRRVLPYRYDGKVDGTILTFVDITAHKLAANRLAVEHKVTRLLADTESFESRVPEILEILREGLNAAICNLWLVDAEGDTLTCAETSLAEQGSGLHAFAEESRKTKFRINEGLPGHVWQTLETHWIEDVTNDPFFRRCETARQCGLINGVALPIIVGKEFRGTIELYSTEPFGFEQSLLDMLNAVSSDIGQFIVSRQLYNQLRDEEARKSAILTAALDCVITMDMAGRIVDFSTAAERTFGYSAADVKGLPLADVIIPERFREQHSKGFRRYLETGASQILGQRIELTAQRGDGSEFPVEVAIHATFARDGRPFFTGYLRDITARKHAEEVLNQRARLASLHVSLAIELSGEAELEDILQKCCQHFVDQLDAAFARIWLFDEKESVLELKASAGLYTHLDGPHSRVTLGDLKIGRIASQRKPVLTNDVLNDPNIGDPEWAKREGLVAFAGYPLLVENRIVGVVAMFTRHELSSTAFEQMVPMGDAIAQCIARKQSEILVHENEVRLREQQTQLISVLAESEATKAKLQVLFDQSMYYAGVLDLNGVLTDINQTALVQCGYESDEVIGKPFWQTPWWSGSQEVQEKIRAAIRRAAAGESYREELPYWLSDGTERCSDFALTPATNENGDVIFLVPTGADVTERKEVELELQRNADRLSMAMKAGGLAAWEWSPESSVWTDELYDLLGIPNTQTACPETFFEVVHPEDLPKLQTEWEKSMQGEQAYNQEFRIVRPDGEVRWIVGMGEVVYDERGEVQRIFGLNWDSTEGHTTAEALRASERRAQEASLSKSAFLANMSHEIRTPMTAVLGYTDLLASRESEPEKLDYLRTIKRNGNFLLDIINDILDLSKIEAGKMELMPELFALQHVLADVRSMMDVRAKEKKLDFRVEFDSLIPSKIESDPKRLKQLLVNLIGNAIKFTQSGSVRLSVKYRGGDEPQIQFDIIDTGIGMTEEQQGKLFQPFSQGDASVTRAFGGTGLGLAISQRLAEMLGGRISAKSEFGVGSTFSVLISAGAVDESDLITPTLDSSSDAALPQLELHRLDCRVLVVDDRRDVRFLAKHFLNKAGADVIMAEDGEKAIQLVEQMNDGELAHVDLILLDMQMPRLDGYQTASKLRNMNYRKPIIALTADAMQGDMSRCLTSGCDAYLSKPIDAIQLLDLVVEYLQIDEDELQSRRATQADRIETQSTLNESASDEDAADESAIKVLIVDDSVDACNLLRLVLEAEQFQAACAYDGSTAIALAREYHPSHVLLDITLSDMSGYEVLQSLRSIPELANTTFMALTGHTGAEHTKRSLEAGFDQHLAKPLEPAKLVKLLRSSAS